ncbi:MAG: HIT family protein [Myxococcota bacterium]
MAEQVADCIFCAIVAGEAPAQKVYEDERLVAFMDAFPVAEGHLLLVPKRHGKDLFETEVEDLRALIAVSKDMAEAIRLELEPEGIFVCQLNGAAAGQTVFHYHMHLIPRNSGDRVRPGSQHGRVPGDPEALARVAARLAAAL